MTAGIQITKADIDQAAGTLARSQFHTASAVLQFKAWLDGLSAQDLIDDYAYSADDANMLKSAVADLADLAGIFGGAAAGQTLPYNYKQFAKNLIGVGVF
jgi:hypothetical protein